MAIPFTGIDSNKNSPIDRLFQSTDFNQKTNIIGKGSVITFNYVGQTRRQIHDFNPLVIVTDILAGYIRAVNLHYLTLPYIRSIIINYANNPNFSFKFISGDAYIVGAFRTYKRNGISQLRMLDTGFLKNLLTVIRTTDPVEIQQMREQVAWQLNLAQQQPKAQPGPEMM